MDTNKINKVVLNETQNEQTSSHKKQNKKNSNNIWSKIKTPVLENKDNFT